MLNHPVIMNFMKTCQREGPFLTPPTPPLTGTVEETFKDFAILTDQC